MLRLLLVLLLCQPLVPVLQANNVQSWDCEPAREFIASYNFLRKNSTFQLSDKVRKETAWQVAAGCHQAAARFIQVLKTLQKADMDPRHALKVAVDLSQGNDLRVQAFLGVFSLAHDRRYFDLDLFQSLSLARSLAVDLKEMPNWLEKDFRRLSLFCLDRDQLAIPRPLCARWVGDLILLTASQQDEGQPMNIGVAEPFFAIFEFLTGKDGPKLTTGDALALAQRLLSISPYAPNTFIDAYKFAAHPSGLGLGRRPALDFAESLADYTVQANSAQALAKRLRTDD